MMKYHEFFEVEADIVCEPANLYGVKIAEKRKKNFKRKKDFFHEAKKNTMLGYKKTNIAPGSKKLFKKTASKTVRRHPGIVTRERGLTKKICKYYC